MFAMIPNAVAVSLYWDGTSNDFTVVTGWSTSASDASLNPAAIPGVNDVATFRSIGVTGNRTISLNGSPTLQGIATANVGSTLTTSLQGGGTNQILNLGASGINHASGGGAGLTIGSATAGQRVDIILQGSQAWVGTAGGLTIVNNVSLGGSTDRLLTIGGGSATSTIQGNISDGSGSNPKLSLTKSDGGTWALDGANTYRGTTSVTAGILSVRNNGALGATEGSSTVSSGATLTLASGVTITGEAITIAGVGASNTGALRNSAGTSEWAGTVTLSGSTPRIGSTGTMTISGAILGGATQELNITGSAGTGIVVISAAQGQNTYGGATNIIRGFLKVGATNSLPTGTVVDLHALAAATENATFDLNNFDQTVAGIQNTGGLIGGTSPNLNPVVLNVTNTGGSMRTLTINNPVARTYSGDVTGANLALTKTGAGTMTLSGTNSYGGITRVNGGTLAIGLAGTLSGTSEIILGTGTLDVSAKGAPGLTLGASQKVSGSGTVTGNLTINGNLAIGNSPGTVTFNNNLTLGGSSVSDFEITSPAFTPGTFDLAQGTGDTVTFGGTLNLLFSGGTYSSTTQNLFPGFNDYFGSFSTINFSGLDLGQSASFDPLTGTITIVPEPGAGLLILCGVCTLLLRRSRRSLMAHA